MANHSNATLFLRLGDTGAFEPITCLREKIITDAYRRYANGGFEPTGDQKIIIDAK